MTNLDHVTSQDISSWKINLQIHWSTVAGATTEKVNGALSTSVRSLWNYRQWSRRVQQSCVQNWRADFVLQRNKWKCVLHWQNDSVAACRVNFVCCVFFLPMEMLNFPQRKSSFLGCFAMKTIMKFCLCVG